VRPPPRRLRTRAARLLLRPIDCHFLETVGRDNDPFAILVATGRPKATRRNSCDVRANNATTRQDKNHKTHARQTVATFVIVDYLDPAIILVNGRQKTVRRNGSESREKGTTTTQDKNRARSSICGAWASRIDKRCHNSGEEAATQPPDDIGPMLGRTTPQPNEMKTTSGRLVVTCGPADSGDPAVAAMNGKGESPTTD
jgi:hypothetical protein